MRDAGRGALLAYSDDDSVVVPAGNARGRVSCAHEGSPADLGLRLCGLLAEVTGPSDEYWRNREATRDAISQVSALHEHLASVDTRSRRFTRNWRYRRMREGSLSERELNSHVCDLRRCSPVQVCKRITAGQGHGFVSEDRLHQNAHGCSPRSFRCSTVVRDDRGRSGYQVVNGAGCARRRGGRCCCVV